MLGWSNTFANDCKAIFVAFATSRPDNLVFGDQFDEIMFFVFFIT